MPNCCKFVNLLHKKFIEGRFRRFSSGLSYSPMYSTFTAWLSWRDSDRRDRHKGISVDTMSYGLGSWIPSKYNIPGSRSNQHRCKLVRLCEDLKISPSVAYKFLCLRISLEETARCLRSSDFSRNAPLKSCRNFSVPVQFQMVRRWSLENTKTCVMTLNMDIMFMP